MVFRKLLLLLLAVEAFTKNISIGDKNLSDKIIPSHYSLDLTLDPRASTYDGYVEITFTSADTSVKTIQLHASSETIKIKEAIINYQEVCAVSVSANDSNDTDIVVFDCPEGSVWAESTLTINFEGTFSTNDMSGLYKSTYWDDGVEVVLLATDFEPADARRAFPCFDVPSLKATYDVFITHPNDYNVVTNTPVANQFAVSSDETQTQFQTTPPMSTYLVAFVVSKFVSNTNEKTREYDFQILSRPSAKDFTSTAIAYGPTLIDKLSDYTGISYVELGNPQAFQVAIPDFEAGAMENWGLITFRELDLLDDQRFTSSYTKQRIITTMAHELSHQWFGDYVTLDWWSNLWLNEGFATFFEYFIPDLLVDQLDTMKQFVVNELQPALLVDAVPSAKSLSSDVESSAEYSDKFDDISYSKGASIVRMLRNILLPIAFKAGINLYLTNNNYSNTNPTDLLNSFSDENGLDIPEIMKNWIYEPGFPLVTASLNESTVTLSQEKFTLENSTDSDTEWYIPINYATEKKIDFDSQVTDWLNPGSTLDIELGNSSSSWIIFNVQQFGYYRVNYDNVLWQRIIQLLQGVNTNPVNIDILNRAQLIDDAFNIARAGRVSYEIAFKLAEYLVNETGYYPWVSALNALSYMMGKLNDAVTEELLKNKILYWLHNASSFQFNITSPDHMETLKIVLLSNWACKLGEEHCIKYATDMFNDFKISGSLPDYNKRAMVLCYGFQNSTTKNPNSDYDFLFTLFEESTSVVVQNDILTALGCAPNADLLNTYLLETITDNSSIRKQDAIYVYRSVYSHSQLGVDVLLSFIDNNLEQIAKTYKGSLLPNTILALAGKIVSDEHIAKLMKIIEDSKDIESVQLISQRAIEIATANRKWSDNYSAEIKRILTPEPSLANVVQSTFTVPIILVSILYLFYNQ